MSFEFFERWVIIPLGALRSVPNDNGAFGALAMTFGLYERFLLSRIHRRGESPNEDARWKEHPDLLDELSATELGSVRLSPPPGLLSVPTSYGASQNTYTEGSFPFGYSSTGYDPDQNDDRRTPVQIIERKECFLCN